MLKNIDKKRLFVFLVVSIILTFLTFTLNNKQKDNNGETSSTKTVNLENLMSTNNDIKIENSNNSQTQNLEALNDYVYQDITSEVYTIKKGDTLWEIAEAKYGSGLEYYKIIEKNPGKVFKFADGKDGLIYEGTILDL
jgi:uncharacterized membrane protein